MSTILTLPYIPNPFSNTPVVLDLTFLGEAEAREHEIAFVNPTKAPELMALFAVTISKLADILPKVHFQHRLAEKKVSERRATVILQVIPDKIAAAGKKMSNNAETRQAFIDLDPEYGKALEDEMVIEAALLLLKEKLYSMKNNLATVQKIYEQSQSMMYRMNPNLITGLPELDRPTSNSEVTINWAPEGPQHIPHPGMNVGKARY